ncbi:type IV pilus assembly protein PilQ [Deinococcus reticulitermitis]|uniref:Type IV pilus assembly protein PilQ n=1 Tax=Deinococcus reticulitermitis TaxID=856736 RepID=A0A1H6X4T0_9DEIO|nr:type IV pilus assembly protein PilQ [Deinococcus reticulitermitis]
MSKEFFGEEYYEEEDYPDTQGRIVKRRVFKGYRLPDTLKIVPDIQNGRLIVGGSSEENLRVRSFIATIDIPGAPAQAVAVPSVTRVYTVKGSREGVLDFLRERFPTLKVSTYGGSGILIIEGSSPVVDSAFSLLSLIDQPAPIPVAQIVQRVFQLVNASAEEVKATLEGTLARDLSAQQENAPLATRTTTAIDANGNPTVVNVPATPTPAATSAAQAASELSGSAAQTTIIADKRTNTLIVRGTTEQVAQISELIPQLDQVVPQINVQVRIQEVTEKAVNALGLNWRANFGGFNVAVSGSSGIAASFNPTQSFLGFNIFPTLTALETQGLTKRIYDGNVSMQSGQRSLGAASRSQAQNASAGAAATIKSGGRLEINIPSVAGNIEKQIDYGVNFDFFDPQVAPDGTITLRVRGQVNTLNSTITPASIPNVLDFSNSEAQSTITFKTGQTVLMSGLLGKTETSNRGGVPFLSSLPVIGPAFGEKRTEKTETQLLVIITGTVVK